MGTRAENSRNGRSSLGGGGWCGFDWGSLSAKAGVCVLAMLSLCGAPCKMGRGRRRFPSWGCCEDAGGGGRKGGANAWPGPSQIRVDGRPFCDYVHRIPPERITEVNADGDLQLQSMTLLGGGMMGGGVSSAPKALPLCRHRRTNPPYLSKACRSSSEAAPPNRRSPLFFWPWVHPQWCRLPPPGVMSGALCPPAPP